MQELGESLVVVVVVESEQVCMEGEKDILLSRKKRKVVCKPTTCYEVNGCMESFPSPQVV